jgi:phosphatidylserine synthase
VFQEADMADLKRDAEPSAERIAEASAEQRRETGTSLMFIGLAICVAGLLVLFFLPAAVRFGQQATFDRIIAVLGVIGVLLIVRGWWMRRGSTAE